MKAKKGFTGEPGRHSMKSRGVDVQSTPELSVPRSGTYAVVPTAAAGDRRLGRCTPLHVLVVLGKYRNAKTGLCVPALDKVAAELGVDRRSVQRHINALIDCGYLVAVGRRRENGGYTSNSYTLLFPGLSGPPEGDGDGGSDHPACGDEITLHEDVTPSASDATLSVAYPPPLGEESVDNHGEAAAPMRQPMSQGGDTECRNPCDTECRNNNSPILTIDSNSPFAEANARARREPEQAADDARDCSGMADGDGVLVEATQHEARRDVPLAKARTMYQPTRDPLSALVKRLSSQTKTPEGVLWVKMLGWHEQIERTGVDNSAAQAILVSIGRSFGHGAPKGDPIPQIDARVRLWVSRRDRAAA